MSTDQDMYAGASETTEGRVFTVTGQDWDAISEGLAEEAEEDFDQLFSRAFARAYEAQVWRLESEAVQPDTEPVV